MSARTAWYIFSIISVILTALLAAGFYLGLKDIYRPGPVAQPPEGGIPGVGEKIGGPNNIMIVALGDSLTRGTGDDSGKGYIGNVQDEIKKAMNKNVLVFNQGINGYRTMDLLEDLQKRSDIRRMLAQADIITITIGGNDLFSLSHDEVNPAVVRKRVPAALARFKRIVDELAVINPRATLLYMGLYNAFYDLPNASETSRVVQQWNEGAQSILYQHPRDIFVATDDLFRLNLRKYLSSDHFHPNREGYKRIGLRMAQAVE
ncbi:GDSL-type esterase/lipase family protein [Aneurinibacillus sp. Ricciae_BoGa-3]|uniref:GDSL-type esterase/lipase family protein n=1 Tax=Aneurinibacillus sp. Ricciae_BoGa-3 TaxID=3022697 RepID=UPI002340F4D5|nr:GDSL-type esterase/lipase family protein [Aneurinibacillus sp. Ricciae_BoGa-3]WCK55885.1 GDSL-type esterase/lipase family protein [Aneurinibacillus sp. Ricciae_BoGa-3]